MDWIEIFSCGTHISKEGKRKTYTEADLDKMVNNFNPDDFKPPVTVGHPENDTAMAWGWMNELKREGTKLLGKFEFVPEFLELLKKGIYKNRSIGVVNGDTINHVAFLGGWAPAVKGLADIKFSNKSEMDVYSTTITTTGVDEMDEKARLQKEIDELKIKLEQYSGKEKEDLMKRIGDLEKQRDAFSAEAAKVAKLEQDLAAEKKKREELEFSAQKKEIESFCDGLVASAQLTKAQRDSAVKVLVSLTGKSESANFAAGETADSVFRKLLSDLPKSTRFETFADTKRAAKTGSEDLAVDEYAGQPVDEDRYSIHQKALQIQNDRKCSYKDAVKFAMRG